jgi:hypothetical protein
MIAPLLALTLLQTSTKPEAPDQVVNSFAHYLSKGEIREACSRVEGGKFTYPALRLQTILKGAGRTVPFLTLLSVERPAIVGNTATVSIRAQVLGKDEPVVEEVPLRIADGRWKIAPHIPELHAKEGPPVSTLGFACAQPTAMLAILTPILHIASGDVMKTPSGKAMGSFSTWTLMYAAMYGDNVPKDTDALRAGLKSVLTLVAPEATQELDQLVKTHEGVTLRINPNLLGTSLLAVKVPERTVLAYEEDEGGISFRHNGKGLFAFADGMIRLLSKEEESGVFWLPQ